MLRASSDQSAWSRDRTSSHPQSACSTLFLCYPDDFEQSDESMAAQCLQHFSGATLVHAGELFGDTPMLDAAPWGRTSARAFQERLFSKFRCGACTLCDASCDPLCRLVRLPYTEAGLCVNTYVGKPAGSSVLRGAVTAHDWKYTSHACLQKVTAHSRSEACTCGSPQPRCCRCILKVPLPSWPHCNDHLTVWRRVEICTMQLSGTCVAFPSTPAAVVPQRSSWRLARSSDAQQGTEWNQRYLSCPLSGRAANDGAGAGPGATGSEEPAVVDARDGLPDSEEMSGSSGSSSGDADDEAQLVCDFKSFEVHPGGYAIPPLQRLLAE
jgi:hypothetical protein